MVALARFRNHAPARMKRPSVEKRGAFLNPDSRGWESRGQGKQLFPQLGGGILKGVADTLLPHLVHALGLVGGR